MAFQTIAILYFLVPILLFSKISYCSCFILNNMDSEARGGSTTVSFIRASFERDEFYLSCLAFEVKLVVITYSKCNIP